MLNLKTRRQLCDGHAVEMERRCVATTAAHNWLSGEERKQASTRASERAYAILAARRTEDEDEDDGVRKRENKSGGENTTSERAGGRTS